MSRLVFASMRPRVFPAEDPLFPSNHAPSLAASMRPRVFPAEDEQQKTPMTYDEELQ